MQFDLFTPKAPPLFGLDISSSSVKMLEIVEAGKGGYRVERYAIEPLARDAVVDGNINNLEAVTDAVRRAHQARGDGGANRRRHQQEDRGTGNPARRRARSAGRGRGEPVHPICAGR